MIYDLHKSFQPMVDGENDSKGYLEFQPIEILRPYIKCFWLSKKQDTIPSESRVIADGCMDIIFSKDLVSGKCGCGFCGLFDQAFTSFGTQTIEMFGIRFYPWAAHLFFKEEMKSFKNMNISLDNCLKALFDRRYDIMNTTIESRINTMECYIIKRLSEQDKINDTVMSAMSLIVKSKGVISQKSIVENTCISDRQLQRLFNSYIGLSPKSMSDIIRFQNIVRESHYNSSNNWYEMTYNYGFNDQSHLIRHFKKFYGLSPKKVFGQK